MAALYDEHETVRYEAAQLYRRHPNNHLFDPSLEDTIVHEKSVVRPPSVFKKDIL